MHSCNSNLQFSIQYVHVGILIGSTVPATFAEKAICILSLTDLCLAFSFCQSELLHFVHLAILAAPFNSQQLDIV